MIFQQQQEDDDHHSPIDCQKVQGLIDLLRDTHAMRFDGSAWTYKWDFNQ